MCRRNEISGQAFCDGLTAFKLSGFHLDTGTIARTGSVVFLMGQAAFRSQYAMEDIRMRDGEFRFSLGIRPLRELIDMSHNREATDRRDKLYALLGMCSDAPANLSPDYTVPWSDLLRRLSIALFGKHAFVETWDDGGLSVITTKASYLGVVTSEPWGGTINDWGGGQKQVFIKWETAIGKLVNRWTTHTPDKIEIVTSARPVMKGDILCSLDGVSALVLLRLSGNHFVVISISTTIVDGESLRPHFVPPPGLLPPDMIDYKHIISLVWDWGSICGDMKEKMEETFGAPPRGRAGTPEVMEGTALFFRDLERYEKAIEHHQMAIEVYKAVGGWEDLRTIAAIGSLMSTYDIWFEKKKDMAMTDFLRRELGHTELPETWIPLIPDISDDSFNIFLNQRTPIPNQATLKVALESLAKSWKTTAMGRFKLLLERQGDHVTFSQEFLETAAKSSYHGYEMVKLILSRQKDLEITQRVYEVVAFDKKLLESVRHKVPEDQSLLEWDDAQEQRGEGGDSGET